jgi:hypothetical protein
VNSKIFGDETLINRVKEASPGDPTIYVNMDAINQLPDQYEAQITEVEFDPNNDWDDVGNGNFMPQPQVYADIALKRGVECTAEEHCEQIIEEVDINPMLCKGLEEPPTVRKMKVGYVATKRGAVLMEDGTYLPSDVCRASYNVWERCTELWAKEEETAQGYDPALVKKYPSGDRYVEYEWDGKKKKRTLKYDNTWKRRNHFAKVMLFAQRNSDTKARHVVIRHLAGLKTGYKKKDFASGSFIFVRIQRSRESLKLRQAAELDAIRRGVAPLPDGRAGQKLFGPPAESADSTLTIHESPEPEPEKEAAEKDIPFGDVPWEEGDPPALTILDVLQAYHDGDLIADGGLKANTKRGLDYMRQIDVLDDQNDNWGKAVALLNRIEDSLDNDKLIAHEKWE